MGIAQLPLHLLGLLGYPTHQVGGGFTTVDLSPTGAWAARTRAGLESDIRATLHDGRRYVRPILRALGRNEVVLSACDGTGGGEEIGRRVPATVLGRTVRLPSFPVWLSLQAGAPVLPLVTWRTQGPGPLCRVALGEPLPTAGARGDRAAEAAGVAHVAAFLERCLQDHPGDWHFWDAWHDGPGGLLRG